MSKSFTYFADGKSSDNKACTYTVQVNCLDDMNTLNTAMSVENQGSKKNGLSYFTSRINLLSNSPKSVLNAKITTELLKHGDIIPADGGTTYLAQTTSASGIFIWYPKYWSYEDYVNLYQDDTGKSIYPEVNPNFFLHSNWLYMFTTRAQVIEYLNKPTEEEKDAYAKQYALNYDEIQTSVNPLNTTFRVYRTGNWKPTTVIKWDSDKIGKPKSMYSEDEVTVIIRAYNNSMIVSNTWTPAMPTDGSIIPDTTHYVLYTGRFSEKKFKIAMTSLENYNPNWWVKPLQIPAGCVYEMWVKADDGSESRHAWAYFSNDNNLHLVTSPYKVALTNWKAGYYYTTSDDKTTAIIEEGDGESDDDYTNPDDDIVIPDAPTPFTSLGFLNTSYALTRARCKSFSNFIWTAGLFDNIKLMNQSPIENIVSCKIFPMAFTGTDETMMLGNVETTTGARIGDTSTFLYDIGTVTVKPYYKSFLDYSPYTTLSIFLPFCGIHELDCKLLMGKSLNVKYAVDVVCGTCKALLYVDGVELYSFDGQMGIDIPIASGTRAQVEKALISGTVSTVSSIATQTPIGVATSLLNTATSSLHNQTSGSHSSATSAYETLQVYLIYDRPVYQNLEGFAHAFGRFCGLTKNLGNLDGFTVCNENVELSGIVCSSEEKEELKSLLTGGVFL